MNAKNDFVFRAENFFGGASGATPDGVMQNYLFVPKTIHVQAGVPLTIYNDDQVAHMIVADDGAFASTFMGTGGSYTMTFDKPGEVAFHCSLHSRMRGTIVVDPPAAVTANSSGFRHGAPAIKTK